MELLQLPYLCFFRKTLRDFRIFYWDKVDESHMGNFRTNFQILTEFYFF